MAPKEEGELATTRQSTEALRRVRTFLRAGNLGEAQRENQAALELGADPLEVQILSGRIALRLGRWTEALDIARAAEERGGGPYSVVVQAQALLGLEDYAGAAAKAARAVDLDPNEPKAWAAYAYAVASMGEQARAATLMWRAVRLEPLEIRRLIEWAWMVAGVHAKSVILTFVLLAGASIALTATERYGLAVPPTLVVVGVSLASVTRAVRGRVTQAWPAVCFMCVVTAVAVGFYVYSLLASR
ncbi:MAG: tetratricopeptide repeat protein [Coriobacteriia bacterium]|nr:tetratricopeptide repeat protein [Coriobacteriia bacterium]